MPVLGRIHIEADQKIPRRSSLQPRIREIKINE